MKLTARRIGFSVLALALVQASLRAEPWVLRNPTKFDYMNERVCLPIEVPANFDPAKQAVFEDGKPVVSELWPVDSKPRLWVVTSLAPGGSKSYEIKEGVSPKADALVAIQSDASGVVLDNGMLGVKLPPSQGAAGPVSAPIVGFRIGGGAWLGKSSMSAGGAATLRTVTGSGAVAGLARMQYAFAGGGTYEVDVVVPVGKPYAIVKERFEGMGRTDFWELDVAAGWAPRSATVQLNNEGNGAGAGAGVPKDKWPRTLATGQTRMGDVLVNLMPRWSQAFDEGWFFATDDGKNMAGALPARAGQWVWPHENLIRVKVKDSADYAGLHCPMRRGSRYWLLIAGPASLVGSEQQLAVRETMANLDKIANDCITDWPGVTKGSFEPEFFFGNQTNPTGARRGMGRSALAQAGNAGDLGTLFKAQQSLDPDWYGRYTSFWSPENPNFYTDFHKVTLGLVAQLRAHPRFEEFRAKAEAIFREDVDHSITLPGGAGQECPGYQAYAIGQRLELAAICKQRLGFDPTTWPRWKASGSFVLHVSQPAGAGGRAFHPGGDTHPHQADPVRLAASLGCNDDPKSFVTEELPGFGAIFRNRPGTDRETYLAFKSGPNRGHYHGDQLSFHYCADARALAVDHHCSYKPRAGQEHMHNRVAFSTDGVPFANMDGYERLIAFKTAKDADVAMGQVESNRLRPAKEFPPEDWDIRQPAKTFDRPIIYRRTIVAVKNGAKDYFVIRDQYWGPKLDAHFCLHVLGDKAEREGNMIRCDGLSLMVAEPAQFEFAKFSWEHNNGGVEKTTGPRITASGEHVQFVTVMYPDRTIPAAQAIAGGVRVGGDEIVFVDSVGPRMANVPGAAEGSEVRVTREGKVVLELKAGDVDFDRSQGDIGLFVPDAGYPFGEIPDWLARQRAK